MVDLMFFTGSYMKMVLNDFLVKHTACQKEDARNEVPNHIN